MTVWLYVTLSVSDCAQPCHILVSWSPDAWWLWELCQTDSVAVSDCVSLPTHVCLGPKGHLAPFLGWLAGLEATSGQNQAGLEVRRAVAILPHPAHQADRQMEKMFTPGAGRWLPHQGLLCAQKTSSSGISSSLAGSGFWVAGSWIQLISAPAGGQESSYLGLNRVTEKRGPHTPYPKI